MAVFRVHKTQGYTVMSNYHLRDRSLSLKAKGLLSIMLSLPDDWDYSMSGLIAICKEGKAAVKSTMEELTAAGYIAVSKLYPNQTSSGRIEYVYNIHEMPVSVDSEQGACIQATENQSLEFQALENQQQLNTKEVSTEEVSTEEVSTERKRTEKENREEVIDYLNMRTGRSYKASNKQTAQHISARMSEGYTIEDFKKVIDNKVAEWMGTEWEKYLQPSTLFAPSHFDEYLNSSTGAYANKSGQFQMRLDEYSQSTKARTQVVHTEYIPKEGR